VVLGEGASEEVVLPRIARALDVDVDPQFIAVVPLGGRHVHHFWRLLRALGTPHLTLVDLDMERHEGGWKRLHGLAHNLIEAGESRDDVRGTLSSSNLDEMRNWAPAAIDDVRLQAFLKHLEDRFAVYLSAPLDLDLACLAAYSGAYQALVPAGQGPRVPSDAIKKKGYLTAATQTVLGDEKETVEAIEGQPAVIRGATYDSASQLLFPLYRYLFLSGSKPVSHARAFATLEDPAIAAACPAVLRRLILRAKDLAETHHA
jgi:putative ATP-dependent endonuclease of OLD family